ncbi:MAG: type III-B CRISPR module RAMP protein Cmr6 [Alicyclobacillaceae bacterium]|nr:type III-B CRISPR module RAMP protein Cmr6 [Alicyclobacillaceae bacterium]
MRGNVTRFTEPGSLLANAGLVYHKLALDLDRRIEDMHRAIRAAVASAPLYRKVYERWRSLDDGAVQTEVYFPGPLALGLGGASALQVGFAFHSLYGVPYIPGSSLKGLASHYAHTVWGGEDPRMARGGELHRRLFGQGPGRPSAGWAGGGEQGLLVFHDALMRPDDLERAHGGTMRVDVMTPHYTRYYTGAGTPDGMEDPVPVPFLSLRDVRFLVRITAVDPSVNAAQEWARFALALLLEALRAWDVGAKTRSGFGRAAGEYEGSVEGRREEWQQQRQAGPRAGEQENWRKAGSGPAGAGSANPGAAGRGSAGGVASAPSPGPSEFRPAQPGMRFQAVRVEDPKGGDRPWFRTVGEPRLEGRLLDHAGRPLPAMGEAVELEVQGIGGGHVNWRWPAEPRAKSPAPGVRGPWKGSRPDGLGSNKVVRAAGTAPPAGDGGLVKNHWRRVFAEESLAPERHPVAWRSWPPDEARGASFARPSMAGRRKPRADTTLQCRRSRSCQSEQKRR